MGEWSFVMDLADVALEDLMRCGGGGQGWFKRNERGEDASLRDTKSEENGQRQSTELIWKMERTYEMIGRLVGDRHYVMVRSGDGAGARIRPVFGPS
jgi:hypothetical protein